MENTPELMRLPALWSSMEQPEMSSGTEQRARLAEADLWKTLLGSERQQLLLGTVITKPASCGRGDMLGLTSASVWQAGRGSAGRSSLYVGPEPSANIDRGVPHPAPITCRCCSVNCAVASQRHLPGEAPEVCAQDNWVVLSLPHDRWRSTRNLPVTLRASALILASG